MKTFDVRLELDGLEAQRGVACQVYEGLSRRTHARVELATGVHLSFEAALGRAAILTIAGDTGRAWHLALGGSRYLGDLNRSHRYLLDLFDPLWLLSHRVNVRKFRNASAREIVERLFAEHGLASRWELGAEPPTRKYCVQYHESDLDFVERLMAFEGIFYRYDEEGTLVLRDDSTGAPRVARDETYELIEAGDAMAAGEQAIHHARRAARLMPGSVALGDYNWKTPEVMLREHAFAERDADLEWYVSPAGFRRPDQGKRLAQMRLEEQRARTQLFEGRGTVYSFAPGQAFTFGSAAGDAFAGEWMLVDLEHRFRGEAESASDLVPEGMHGEIRFSAMPLDKPFRPAQKPRPDVPGSHTALVRGPAGEEIHTDRYGRFRAQMHWDREATASDDDSRWLRKVQEVATSQGLARVDWEMYTGYIDGDPDRPLGIGRAINGAMPPEYPLPANKNVLAIKTPSSPATGGYNEIKLDDSGAGQQFSLRAEKDLDALVKNDKLELVGKDETHTVGNDFARQVSGDQSIAVVGSSDATYNGNYDFIVEGNRSRSVGGAENVEVVKTAEHRIGGNDREKVGTLRFTFAGSFTTPDIGQLASSAAMAFTSTASPGGASLAGRYEGYASTLSNPSSLVGGGSVEGAATGIVQQGGQAALDAALSGGDAGAAFGSGFSQGLDGLLPSQDTFQSELSGIQGDLDQIIPTQDTLTAGLTAGADAFTGGLYSSLKGGDYQAALNQAIDMFFVGNITRSAEGRILKLVGGVYLTAAVQDIRWDVGLGYLETVGGVKITVAMGHIETTSDGMIVTTVGGAAMRTSLLKTGINAAVSTISVGGAMNIFGGEKVEVRGEVVTVTAGASLRLEGGGASITMTPSKIEIEGDLDVDGATAVRTTGEVYITE